MGLIRGLYTSAAGMLATQSQSERIADNITNAQTVGYKEESAAFTAFNELLLNRVDSQGITPIGTMGTGVYVDTVTKSMAQGALTPTEKMTDFALSSEGWFSIETPLGERYTRSGEFKLDQDGSLVTNEGYYVLGQNGRIQLKSDTFTVNSQGQVAQEGTAIDSLRIMTIPQDTLQREGESLYTSSTPALLTPAANVQVRQGYLEQSNVDLSRQMTEMIKVMRAYEGNQRILQTQNETLGKAVNEIGKV